MPTQRKPTQRAIGRRGEGKTTSSAGKSWFLGIGINNYKYFPNLNNAVKDVEDLKALLEERYDIDTSLTLLNEEANYKNITKTFERLRKEVKSSHKLLIYYSGHGHLEQYGEDSKGFWVPTDAEKGDTHQYFRNSTLKDYLEGINALHTLLISDSCFSGSLFMRGLKRTTSAIEEWSTIRSRWGISSGRHDEEVYDGEPGTNSPFASSILHVLRENNKLQFNVGKLVDQVAEMTRAKYRQLPEGSPLYGVGHQGGQYIFILKSNEEANWQHCQKIGTIKAIQEFLEKHPNGKFAKVGKNKLAALEAERDWEQLNGLPEENYREVLSKIQRIHWFLDTHQGTTLTEVAENHGEYLQYKQEFLKIQNNLFALRKFVLKDTPFQASAKTRIHHLEKELQEKFLESEQAAKQQEIEAQQRANSAAKQQEELIWEDVKKRNTIEAFQGYLQFYPKGAFVSEARLKISQLRRRKSTSESEKKAPSKEKLEAKSEWSVWQDVQGRDTIAAYEGYLQLFPKGKYITEARAKIEQLRKIAQQLEEKKHWNETVLQHSVKGYQNYLKLYPKGEFVGEAKKRMKQIQLKIDTEINAWMKAIENNNVKSFESFLQNFPDGSYSSSAEQKIKDIRYLKPGTFEDARDGKVYKTLRMHNGLVWFAQNLDFEVKKKGILGGKQQSWYYDNSPNNKHFGRLYTWEAAQKACPPGWRLPTDLEWQDLALLFGGFGKDADDKGLQTYLTLTKAGKGNFHAKLGGWRNPAGVYRKMNTDGYYWTGTKGSKPHHYTKRKEPLYVCFRFDQTAHLSTSTMSGGMAYSCRCVKREMI